MAEKADKTGAPPAGGAPTEMTALLERVAATADNQAFASLFEFFAPRVKGFLIAGGATSEEAEDLAQDTMVKVYNKAKLFDSSKASASTWIFTIARNARIDALRRAARPLPEPDDPLITPEESPRADEECERKERDARILEAIGMLPPEQREVMRLYFYEDEPHTAISERLNTPLGTVKSRLRLAFEKVRKELGDLNE